jgi:hypothetical protein
VCRADICSNSGRPRPRLPCRRSRPLTLRDRWDDHLPAPRIDIRAREPLGVEYTANAIQFSTTVAQKTVWCSRFLDLCRNTFCASSAPGHPPISPNRCKVLSLARHCSFSAAGLSKA